MTEEKNWDEYFEHYDPDDPYDFEWKGEYTNGEEEGLWEGFDKEGLLRERIYYKKGKRHGAWQSYWKNGQLGQEDTFQNEEYHENGSLLCKGNAKDEEDLWEYFDEEGNPGTFEESIYY